MDCRTFRTHHFAYLDDTLPGDVMADAQVHIMACDACAAHDTLVRRSLMLVRSLPSIEPSVTFNERLQARLATCRTQHGSLQNDPDDDPFFEPAGVRRGARRFFGPRAWLAMVAGVTVVATAALRTSDVGATELELAPVMASAPVELAPPPTPVSAELVQAMSSGNAAWPMTLLLENAHTSFLSTRTEFGLGSFEH